MAEKYFDYYELADDCYFVDSTSSIVKISENQHFKLGPMAAFITRFLVLKVKKETVGQILVDNYGIGSLLSANEIIEKVINNLGDFIIGVAPPLPPKVNPGETLSVLAVRQVTETKASTCKIAIPIIAHQI